LNDKEYNWMGFDPKLRFGLQPMNDVHFNTALTTSGWNEGGVVNVASPVYSYTFMGIALFILVMAAINFINISIASSLKRAKEVGIRKISGGNGRQIIFQFLVESAILCIASFLIAFILMALLLPVFNSVTGKQLFLSNIFDSKLLLYFSALLVLITLLTGLYPAFVLSRFDATKVLYNKQKLTSRNIFGRSLVVLQFSLAIFLVAGTIVYYSQMNFIRTKDLGYNPSQIITTEVYGDRGDYAPILNYMRAELSKQASIKSVSFGYPGGNEDIEFNDRKFSATNKAIDEHFLSIMEIPLLAGRNVKPGTASKNEALVNQAFLKETGLQNPLGQTLLINRGYDSVYKTIVGIFRDYHFNSLREPIKPMIMHGLESESEGYVIWVKFEKVNQQKAMAAVERTYKTIMPKALYTYNFVDEKNAQEYIQEQRWHKLINFASILALILCSLGLFGLAHLATHQRVKEIGVRKVLGASVAQIVSLFTTSFLKLVLVAIIIAVPTAWIVINKWLENFAYRIEIGWWMFALAGLIAIIIAILTVSTQAIKAALANPAKSLKTE
jgi:putative ABC transport system permease protein